VFVEPRALDYHRVEEKPMARPAIHPGEILADELTELKVTPTELSRQISVPPNRISQIIHGKRAITGDAALRLGHWFQTSAHPSPLLDWSRSPFIAAYFAFCADVDPGSKVAIYAYTERSEPFKTHSSEEAQIHRFGPYVAAHQRHFAQQSQYTICIKRSDSRWHFLPHSSVFRSRPQSSTQDILQKFVLDISDRPKVLSELNDYNLNAYSLFASEEGLMETLSIREEIRSYVRPSA
jgi:addiction module HigA family antidote